MGWRFAWALAALVLLSVGASADAPRFQTSSKGLGHGTMDLVVTEVERRPRTSVVDVTINVRGSSVGSSMFIACSLRKLARERRFRYIAKLDDHPAPGQMLVGFLSAANEDPRTLGPEFKDGAPSPEVIDMEQFAPVCGVLN